MTKKYLIFILIISIILNLFALFGIYYNQDKLFKFDEIIQQHQSYGYMQAQSYYIDFCDCYDKLKSF